MRCLLITIGILATPLGALALTWDFGEGTTWGWTAQESFLGNNSDVTPTTVYSEVEDGVWRITPVPGAQYPAINLLSPLIGEDSALFDRITLRLRIIHDRPTGGDLLMDWSNVESRRRKNAAGYREIGGRLGFSTGRYQLYPTEWENITIDIRALEAAAAANLNKGFGEITEIVWQDTLFHFLLHLNLNSYAQSPADHPEFLEVDWIQLTGAEELLLGELPPRKTAGEAGPPGALFAEPRFSVLGPGIGGAESQGTLGDVDGDGDADLVVVWTYYTFVWVTENTVETTTHAGWTIAASDGLGGLVPTREVRRPRQDDFAPILGIAGGDFDGDGLLDLAFREGLNLELWHNRGEHGFETILQLSDVNFRGLADGDGDGDVDLLIMEYDNLRGDYVWSEVIMWLNDGVGGFRHSDQFVLDTEEELAPFLLVGQPLGEAVRLLWNRPCYKPVGPWRLTQPWAASDQSPLFFDAEVNPCDLHLLADLNGDGAVELVGIPERNLYFDFYAGSTYHGLSLWRVDALGGVKRHDLLGPEVLVPAPYEARTIASDLTGDGLLDLAVVDVNPATGSALVVLVGQRDGVPVVEGRYPLPGVGDEVLAGDVNGDGATDLVVLGRSMEGGDGGAFVFLNQGVPAATAIAAETTSTPTAFALGANYPNPFNPATTILVSVAADAGDVDLIIYNVLGQPVRQVWNGPLAAGEHRLTWDGRDGQGQSVAAGVYLYRLQAGDQTRLRKMVKLE
ncbi:MAG: T9SS type A sorting domain-containing protein [Gemmatimonadetes bacterium]|nr:T9SS type A sorting domain-containing protein [Gemmatimonadota bacterium]